MGFGGSQDPSQWMLEEIMAPLTTDKRSKKSHSRAIFYFEPPEPDPPLPEVAWKRGFAQNKTEVFLGPYKYYVIGPRNNFLGKWGAKRVSQKWTFHQVPNAIISTSVKAVTAFCLLLSQKNRRFQRDQPLTVLNLLFGLEVELYFNSCWTSEEWTKGTTSSFEKIFKRLFVINFYFLGLIVDLVYNVRRHRAAPSRTVGARL